MISAQAFRVLLSACFILSIAARMIIGKRTVASPITVANFPPDRTFRQLIASSSGAPLRLPASGLSNVI